MGLFDDIIGTVRKPFDFGLRVVRRPVGVVTLRSSPPLSFLIISPGERVVLLCLASLSPPFPPSPLPPSPRPTPLTSQQERHQPGRPRSRSRSRIARRSGSNLLRQHKRSQHAREGHANKEDGEAADESERV